MPVMIYTVQLIFSLCWGWARHNPLVLWPAMELMYQSHMISKWIWSTSGVTIDRQLKTLSEIPVSVPLPVTNPICQDSYLGKSTVYKWRLLYSEDYLVNIIKRMCYVCGSFGFLFVLLELPVDQLTVYKLETCFWCIDLYCFVLAVFPIHLQWFSLYIFALWHYWSCMIW